MSWTTLIDIGRKNLIMDPVRSAVALVGVTFAALLMLLQSGIYLGFVKSASALIDHCPADLWLVRAGAVNLETAAPFPDDTVAYVRGTPGIAWAQNLIYSFGHLRLPTGTGEWAHVVGFDPRNGIGGPWEMAQGSTLLLTKPGTVIIDQSALGQFEGAGVGDTIEHFGRKIEIVGMSRGSRTCTPNPVVYTSFRTAQQQLPGFHDQANLIVAKIRDGTDPEVVVERLRRLEQFQVFLADQFSAMTQHYWAMRTGVGIGIGVTILLGFLVGLVILGQTMYASTMARLEEFAALKILGATNLQICAIIWYQAVLLAVTGYGLAVFLGVLVKQLFMGRVVSVQFSASLMVLMALATLVMCLAASLLSVGRVLKVSPATIFRV